MHSVKVREIGLGCLSGCKVFKRTPDAYHVEFLDRDSWRVEFHVMFGEEVKEEVEEEHGL